MTIKKAVRHNKVNLSGVGCDSFILECGTAALSERGTANMLGMKQAPFQRMVANWPPPTLAPFMDKDLIVNKYVVEVTAKNSFLQGQKITVYDSKFIEGVIRAYAVGLAKDLLRPNQRHVGERCITLMCAFILTALDAAIREACDLSIDVPKTAREHYLYAVTLLKVQGLIFSVPNDIATKKDLIDHFEVTTSQFNTFVRKPQYEIAPIKLVRAAIRALGSKASRMNGYTAEDVGKIALNMNSKIKAQLNQSVFGEIGSFDPYTKGEIEWYKQLIKVCNTAGFDLLHNHQVGNYKVDFVIPELQLGLECNGYVRGVQL